MATEVQKIFPRKSFIPKDITSFSYGDHVIIGWNKYNNKEKIIPEYPVNEFIVGGFNKNTDLYACWGYYLSTESNDASYGYTEPNKKYCYKNENVEIKAIPYGGHFFLKWNDGNTQQTRNIQVTSNITLTAYFDEGPHGQLYYLSNRPITITYYPNSDEIEIEKVVQNWTDDEDVQLMDDKTFTRSKWRISSWNDKSDGTGNKYECSQLTYFEESKILYAIWDKKYFRVNVYAGTGGTASGTGDYEYNSYATLQAYPAANYSFSNWSDGDKNNPRYLQVTKDTNISASFNFYFESNTAGKYNRTLKSGTYEFIVVGGGGEGSGSKFFTGSSVNRYASAGGGSGAYFYGQANILEDTNIEINIGAGSENSNIKFNGVVAVIVPCGSNGSCDAQRLTAYGGSGGSRDNISSSSIFYSVTKQSGNTGGGHSKTCIYAWESGSYSSGGSSVIANTSYGSGGGGYAEFFNTGGYNGSSGYIKIRMI